MQERNEIDLDQAIDEYLYVGMPAIYYPDAGRNDQPRYRTRIRGWRSGAQIMIDRPFTGEGKMLAMNVIKKCALKFIRGGEACAASCHVIEWDTRSHFPVARLSWPQDFRRVSFRRHERVNLQVPCTIRNRRGTELHGKIENLSEGGCRVTLQEKPSGRRFELDCDVPHGPLLRKVQMELKHLADAPGQFSLGFMFDSLDPDVEAALADCLTLLKTMQSPATNVDTSKQCVILIDSNESRAQGLREAFETFELSVLVAANPMEGLARMSVLGVVAVFIANDLADISSEQIIQIIHSSKRHETLPIIVFGPDGVCHQSRESAPNSAGDAPETATMLDNIVQAVSRHLTENA